MDSKHYFGEVTQNYFAISLVFCIFAKLYARVLCAQYIYDTMD